MRKNSVLLTTLVMLACVCSTQAWVSVGLSGEAGYDFWSAENTTWAGSSWAIGTSIHWQPNIFGVGLENAYGFNTVAIGDSSLTFSVYSACASARIAPIPFLFIEAGGGYGMLNDIILQGEDLTELPASAGSPLVKFGLGGRVRIIDNLACEVEAKSTLFLWPGNYWNPAARLGLAYDFGREPVRWQRREQITAKPEKVKQPRPKKPKKPKTTPSQLPPHLEILELALVESSGNNALDAEESGHLLVRLRNAGPGTAKNLTVRVSSQRPTPSLSFTPSVQISKLDVGQEKEVRISLVAAEDIPTRVDTLYVEVEEPIFQNNVLPQGYAFQIYRMEPPSLIMPNDNVAIHDDANPARRTYGNGDSRLQPGETVLITAIIENRGTGAARNVRFTLNPQTLGVAVLDTTTDITLGTIHPGSWDTLSFLVNIPTVVTGDSVSFSVKLEEQRARFSKDLVWSLPMNAELPTEVVMMTPQSDEPEEPIATLPKFTSDVDFPEPRKVQKNPNALAVVIGASNYQDVANVEYARKDMSAVREHLINVLGFEKENVYTVTDPVLSDFTTWFGTSTTPQGKLQRKVAVMEDAEVFIYYSGHGVPSITTGDPYLVPVDCDPNYPEQGGYSLKQLYTNLNELGAKEITVVLDACFSGSSPGGDLIREASPAVMAKIDPTKEIPENFNVLAATAENQFANWLREEQHGLFTYYFLKGLQGTADDGDKELTWGELKNYVIREVSRAAVTQDREQNPVFNGDESRILVKWR